MEWTGVSVRPQAVSCIVRRSATPTCDIAWLQVLPDQHPATESTPVVANTVTPFKKERKPPQLPAYLRHYCTVVGYVQRQLMTVAIRLPLTRLPTPAYQRVRKVPEVRKVAQPFYRVEVVNKPTYYVQSAGRHHRVGDGIGVVEQESSATV